MMNLMRELIEAIVEDGKEQLGVEGLQEVTEDQEFIGSIIPTDFIEMMVITMVMAEEAFPDDYLAIIQALSINAICLYRDFLAHKGIDVRALEGR